MADDKEVPEDGAPNGTEKKSKKGLFLGGGMAVLVGVAYFGATMGAPAIEPIPQFQGPSVLPLMEDTMQVNLATPEGNTYMLMKLNAEFDAYDPAYFTARNAADEGAHFNSLIRHRLISMGETKTKAMVQSSESKDAFLLEIRDGLDPILFPVHIGDTTNPSAADSTSGLKPGDSTIRANLRGRFEDHTLYLDGPAKTLRLDEGDSVGFNGNEIDLMVTNQDGNFIYLNVTEASPEFVGELKVGVKGRIRKILKETFLVQ
jgi:flagellar basal body-associated protein FliL